MTAMARAARSTLAAWFSLTREERWLVAGILGLALLGLTARYLHQRGQEVQPVPAPPAAAFPGASQ